MSNSIGRCNYTMTIGERKGKVCGVKILVDGRTKCCKHTQENMERRAEYNRVYKRRIKLLAEKETEREEQQKKETELEEQQATDHFTNLKELMEITKRNNDLLLLLTMAIAGMNKNKRESNV